MRQIEVRRLRIGDYAYPKICVPITGRTRRNILTEALHQTGDIDITEWRADYDAEDRTPEDYAKTLRELRNIEHHRPILFTLRREAEGGFFRGDEKEYRTIIEHLLDTDYIDILDLEISLSKECFLSLAEKARAHEVFVLASSHNFKETPPKKDLLARMMSMEALGADITKLAVMPHTEGDVRTLLAASEEWKSRASVPFLMISMGERGLRSRIGCELYGSNITFGSRDAGSASAPGQPDASGLRRGLDHVRRDLLHLSEAAVRQRLEDGFYTKDLK